MSLPFDAEYYLNIKDYLNVNVYFYTLIRNGYMYINM